MRVRRTLNAILETPSAFEGEGKHSVGDARRTEARRLSHGQELLHRHVVQFLHRARGPFDAYRVDVRGVAQAEVSAEPVLATKCVAAGNFPQLPSVRATHQGADPDFGSNG